MGTWKEGVLDKQGTELDMMQGTYEGDYRYGLRHGFGTYEHRAFRGTYVGTYSLGERAGRGLIDYTKEVKEDDAAGHSRGLALADALSAIKTGAEAPDAVVAATRPVGSGPTGPAGGAGAGSAGPPTGSRLDAKKPPAAKSDIHVNALAQPKKVEPAPDDGAYRAEGRYRANHIRAEGLFVNRNGKTDPLQWSLMFTLDNTNSKLPALDDIWGEEEATAHTRAARTRIAYRSVRDQRASKEKFNLQRFAYWSTMAQNRMLEFIRRNAADRGYLDEIAKSISDKQQAAERAKKGLTAAMEENTQGGKGGAGDAATTTTATAARTVSRPGTVTSSRPVTAAGGAGQAPARPAVAALPGID